MLRGPAFRAIALALLLAATAGGCSILQPQPDRTRYYVLAALAPPPAVFDRDLRVGIGPLILPDYLARYQMVRRKGLTELRYSDINRWAETLADGAGRTLVENVAMLVGTKRVMLLPAPIRGEPDVTVPIEIIRFEPDPDGDVNLVARWVVRLTDGDGKPGEVRLSQIVVRPEGSNWKARSEAMSRALLDLSREISAVIVEATARP